MRGSTRSGLAAALGELVALAPRLSGLPIAFVRLEREDAGPEVIGTGIPDALEDPALVRRVRASPGLVTIDDIAADEELAGGPLAGRGARFVAALALPHVAGGIPGVLCVAGTGPVSPGEARLDRVRVLAEHIARRLAVPSRLAMLEAGSAVRDAHAGEGIGEMRGDPDGGDLILSPAARQMLGVRGDRLSRDEAVALILGDGEREAERLGAAIRAGEQPAPWQAPITARDGRVRWLEIHLAIEPRPGGDPLVHSVLLDLTERRLLESLAEELSARETAQAELEHLLDNLAVATGHTDPDGVILRANRALAQLLGVPAEELVGTHAFPADRWPQETRERALRSMRAAAAGERSQFEGRTTLPMGERIIRGVASPVTQPDGSVSHVVVNFFDLTGERRAEHMRMVEESFRQLQAIMDGAPSAIYVKDREGRYVFLNRAASESFGLPAEELLGKRASDLPGHEDVEPLTAQALRVFEHGEPVEDEVSVTGTDGISRHYSVQKFPLRTAEGEIHAVCGIATDISERRTLDAERRRRSEQQVLIGTLAKEVAAGLDGPALTERAVRAARAGLGGAVGVEVMRAGDGEPAVTVDGSLAARRRALDLANAAIDAGTAQHVSDGTAVPVFGHGGPAGALVVLADVLDDHDASDVHFLEEIARLLSVGRSRERAAALEAELDRSRRLESIGKLAGGVAHDFNNLLAVILNYASFAAEGLEDGQDNVRADLAEITSAAERAAELTHQLLLFGRESRDSRAVSQLNDVIGDLSDRLRALLAPDVQLEVSLDPTVAAVPMSADETEQVLMALVLNARDAIAGRGAVLVETNRESEDVVVLRVRDDGRGMAPEVLDRAFEPFFTTRPPGEISGLGLATVHGIIRRAGGRIEIESSEGEGTTVHMHLPQALHTGDDLELSATEPPEAATILVVDDQAPVREVARRILEADGYHVIVARGPQDARAIASSGQEQIDLLLTDVVMPGESGLDLAASLDQQPVLFMSGYADAILDSGGLAPGMQLLEKPFTKASLLEAVETALTTGAGAR